jgi:hypothetical protein
MKNPAVRGGRLRKLLTLVVVATPWILKDHLATALDEDAREAQQVLIEENNQEQAKEQGLGQREMIKRLARIETELLRAGRENRSAEITQKEAQEEMDNQIAEVHAMRESVRNFEELQAKVALTAADSAKVNAAMSEAEAAATALEQHARGTEGVDPGAFPATWDSAEEHMHDAFQTLLDQAEKDRDSSARAAQWARVAAWSVTLLAAAMMGDWKKVLGLGSGNDEKSEAAPTS